jgi:tRNA(Ile)-lysidine synthase
MTQLKARVLNTVNRYSMILPGEKVMVGVSGGPDSMALLYLLYDLREELECVLHIAHLDHMLRGEESRADAAYVAEHARKLGLPITAEAIDVHEMIMPKESLESSARRVRYEFYERVMASVRADKIAQGHNADDQAETVIMRLLRGSGAQGLGGIPPVRDSKYVRPLIEVSRSEIDEYLQQLQITPRQDLSNLNTVYKRNKIRHRLIPLLEQEYSPNIRHILGQTGDILRAEDELLTALAREAMDSCVQYPDDKTVMMRISDFRGYHLALQRRILRLAIRALTGELKGFDYDHISDLLNLALSGTTGSIINLPREVLAEKTYDLLVLRSGYQPEDSIGHFDYRVEVSGEMKIPGLGLSIKTKLEKTQDEHKISQADADRLRANFDYDKIHGDLHLRNRRPGDRFQPLGMSGTKKLKDFFIDEKIPRAMRDSIPVLTDGNDILWIIGYRIDDRFKITSDTKTQLGVTVIPDQTSGQL